VNTEEDYDGPLTIESLKAFGKKLDCVLSNGPQEHLDLIDRVSDLEVENARLKDENSRFKAALRHPTDLAVIDAAVRLANSSNVLQIGERLQALITAVAKYPEAVTRER
jgi:hypothetical protein